jgi:hypothetical protein
VSHQDLEQDIFDSEGEVELEVAATAVSRAASQEQVGHVLQLLHEHRDLAVVEGEAQLSAWHCRLEVQ